MSQNTCNHISGEQSSIFFTHPSKKFSMKITEKKKVTKEITVTKDILCNSCGKTCSAEFHRAAYYGLIEVKVSGGCSSPVLEDLTTYTFSLCENCLGGLFETFKLPVETASYNI